MREGKRRASKESRRLRVEARRERDRQTEQRRLALQEHERGIRTALAKPRNSALTFVERYLQGAEARSTDALRELLAVVAEKAPRLITEELLERLELMARTPWVRPPSAWLPEGKGRERLFRSLAEHVLARYRMPSLLWSAFAAGEDREALVAVTVHVASGGSLYDAVRTGLMPVPLTRRMCHEVLSGAAPTLLEAVRKAQLKAAGGDLRLLHAWLATRAGRRLHDRAGEEFWQTVLAWFCANPMLPHSEVAPLADYIAFRRGQEAGFSMKGRSVLALLRAMRAWHGELARAQATRGRVFAPSGLEAMDLDRSRRDTHGSQIVEVWHFREVLDAKTLADEGRAMGHCVYSYASSIEKGECSIWTLSLEDDTGHWRRLTIEIRDRQIVQARGRFNKPAEARDHVALRAWAGRNRLGLAGF